jgi:Ca2+-transporting ATPase
MPGKPHHASYSTSSPYTSNPSSSPYTRRPSQYPPSSTFFSEHPDDEHEMQPVVDAERHFGSSSSFRRQSGSSRPMASNDSGYFESIRSTVIEQGPSGIWDRLVNVVTGVKQGESPEQNGYELAPKAAEQSPSAKYSSYDAEVRPLFVPHPCFLPDEKCMI